MSISSREHAAFALAVKFNGCKDVLSFDAWNTRVESTQIKNKLNSREDAVEIIIADDRNFAEIRQP